MENDTGRWRMISEDAYYLALISVYMCTGELTCTMTSMYTIPLHTSKAILHHKMCILILLGFQG